jgi:hypothetical protein
MLLVSLALATEMEFAYEFPRLTEPAMFWIFEILLPILGASLLRANLGFLLR